MWKKTEEKQSHIKLWIWRLRVLLTLRALWVFAEPYVSNLSAHHKRSGRVGSNQLTTIISWDSRDGPSLSQYLLLWNIIVPGIWMDQVLPAFKKALETWFFLWELEHNYIMSLWHCHSVQCVLLPSFIVKLTTQSGLVSGRSYKLNKRNQTVGEMDNNYFFD